MKKLSFLVVFALLSVYVHAQFTISGKVTDTKSNPLIGANIQIKNSYSGTYSDVTGEFIFKKIKAGEYVLQISYMGYESTEKAIEVSKDKDLIISLKPSSYLSDEIIVAATRAGDNSPTTYTNIKKEDIEKQNMGQDIPYMLALTPSLVTTSDAGTGIGYTGFRIRGTDQNRINVTINGIPMNDAESHSVYWVDLPDFASSVDNIQIQRGVGTSTNGAASFGASLNLQTTTLNTESYAKISANAGSFNTLKTSISIGSGLINDHFTFDARLSNVKSDGFIDRANVDLKSYFLTGGYYNKNTILKVNAFSGIEDTYQAWNGVPSAKLNNDSEALQIYRDHYLISENQYNELLNSNSRTYNIYSYENEIDHYKQDHYQFIASHEFSKNLNFNGALHYTKGNGYYEQYKEGEDFEDYNIDNLTLGDTTIESTNLIRRKWLDNDFHGLTTAFNYKLNNINATLGGGWNKYDGDHFGKIIWSQYASNTTKGYKWYNNNGEKSDFNVYAKINYQLSSVLNIYGDLQYRKINYTINGIDDNLRDITQKHNFDFINPKFGIFYKVNDFNTSYFSFGLANREPNRGNFIDADPSKPIPTYETLYDYELGYTFGNKYLSANINLFYMDYKDQLVLTGEINDVGDAIMTNVSESYRSGIEIILGAKYSDIIEWQGNITLSQNKIIDYIDYIDDWDDGIQNTSNFSETDLSFSPKIIAKSELTYHPIKKLDISLISNYVGEQFIDNTANSKRMLDAYFVNNLRFGYKFSGNTFKNISIHLLVNNLLDTEYETNAWVYRYILGEKEYKMDGYFPQAGRHFMAGITLEF